MSNKISISDIKEILWGTFRANKRGKIYVPCFLGDSGLGKTQGVDQFASELKAYADAEDLPFMYTKKVFAGLEGPDVKGNLFTKLVDDEMIQVLARPEFLPKDSKTAGIFFADEINRAGLNMLDTLLQCFGSKHIDKNIFPTTFMPIAACNDVNKRYSVQKLDTAYKSRFVFYELEYSRDDLVSYAKKNSWHPNVIGFLADKAEPWKYRKATEVADTERYVCSRTWEWVSETIEREFTGRIREASLFGALGSSIASAYITYCKNDAPVNYHDLIDNSKVSIKKLINDTKNDNTAKLQLTFESIGANMSMTNSTDIKLIQSLMDLFYKEGRQDIGKMLNDTVVLSLRDKDPRWEGVKKGASSSAEGQKTFESFTNQILKELQKVVNMSKYEGSIKKIG